MLEEPLVADDGTSAAEPPSTRTSTLHTEEVAVAPALHTEVTTVPALNTGGGAVPAPIPTSTRRVAAVAFTAEQLRAATTDFSTVLGRGKYGTVFRGTLPDGRPIAVKRMTLPPPAKKKRKKLLRRRQQGGEEEAGGSNKYSGETSFRRELSVLQCYHHRNLVSMYGWCFAEQERKRGAAPPAFSLVLELLPEGSLLDRLAWGARAPPTAQQRCAIAADVARGLNYLHTVASPPLIHQDVKSDNVLLTVDLATGRASSLARHA